MLTHFPLDILHSLYSFYSYPYYNRSSLNGSHYDPYCFDYDDYFGICNSGLTMENQFRLDESTC